ncbi:unnamed protein product [Paramecium octaurelia]|uniref:Uncharacterized protein n=1 Tax=Paramecium octaurelia TaxID=43137 RepID=A0A8S1VDP5_PAROT|nr:unnamed protein product [Paramecium octaurelia]
MIRVIQFFITAISKLNNGITDTLCYIPISMPSLFLIILSGDNSFFSFVTCLRSIADTLYVGVQTAR